MNTFHSSWQGSLVDPEPEKLLVSKTTQVQGKTMTVVGERLQASPQSILLTNTVVHDQYTEYPLPKPFFQTRGLTIGPDGALWFTDVSVNGGYIGRMSLDGNSFQSFLVATEYLTMADIVAGPDGALWFSMGNKIGRMTLDGRSLILYPTPHNAVLGSLIVGPDGALWFCEVDGDNSVGRMTMSGVVTEFPVPTANAVLGNITVGPDNALWFTESPWLTRDGVGKIARMTTQGNVTEFTLPTADAAPLGIVSGPNRSLWFTEYSANKIGRLSLQGLFAEFGIPTAQSYPRHITQFGDGALAFDETSGIGRIDARGIVTEVPFPASNTSWPISALINGGKGVVWFTRGTNVISSLSE